MYPVFETLRIKDNVIDQFDDHIQRMQNTAGRLWNCQLDLTGLQEKIMSHCQGGLQKCNIHYNAHQFEISVSDYMPKNIHSFVLAFDDDIQYDLKYTDRESLHRPLKNKMPDVEVIFVKHSKLTDTSYSNIALWNGVEWHTPKSPLLKGTKRQQYIHQKRIVEKDILVTDLVHYQKIALINAMLDLNDLVRDINRVHIDAVF